MTQFMLHPRNRKVARWILAGLALMALTLSGCKNEKPSPTAAITIAPTASATIEAAPTEAALTTVYPPPVTTGVATLSAAEGGQPTRAATEASLYPPPPTLAPVFNPTASPETDVYPGPEPGGSAGPTLAATLPPATQDANAYPPPETAASTPTGPAATTTPTLPAGVTAPPQQPGISGTPGVPTRTPVPTSTPRITPTRTPTATPIVPTKTPTLTPTPPLPAVDPDLHASDPRTVRLAAGKVQVVEFFAFWDVHSMEIAPAMNGLESLYVSRANFIFLDIDDPAVQPLKKALHYRSQPQVFLLSPSGEVIKQWSWPISVPDIRSELEAALGRYP